MSVLGQKQTCALQNVMSAFTPNSDREIEIPQKAMSALPPKADMCSALGHVCFGPKADIGPISDERNRSRQNHPDFGELARLRIDFD